MKKEQTAMKKRYVSSARHTMQVDFELFLAQLKKESRRGRKRAERNRKTGVRLPVPSKAHLHVEKPPRKGRAA